MLKYSRLIHSSQHSFKLRDLLLPASHWISASTSSSSSIFFDNHSEDERNLPRITCPQKLVRNLERSEQRKRAKQDLKRKRNRARGPLLISCKRKNYNFYQGQNFDERDVESLVSCGWKNTKRVGDYFTLMAHAENPSIQEEDGATFQELGISDKISEGLTELGLHSPTEIQALAIPHLMQGENIILAAETGSGKTLSYLLPLLEWTLKKKQALSAEEQLSTDSPSAVIISPNRELSSQIMAVAESLVPYADVFPQCSFSGYHRPSDQPLDLLITTPGNMNRLLKKRLISGNRLQHMVVDEADTILDDSFVDDLQSIFRRLNIIPAEEIGDETSRHLLGTQIALVSATMPRNIQASLGTLVPVEAFTKVTTNALHRLPPHVPQKFIRINPDSKPEKLVHLLSTSPGKPTLVFVKDAQTCYYVASMLEEMGLSCLSLSGNLSHKKRQGVFTKFVEGYEDILVATDIASRGLDTVHVSHVINYDFPQHMSDYIHRVGRVGRVSSKQPGQVTSLVSHKWDVDLLWKIEIAARKGKYLGDVNANIKQKLDGLKLHRDTFEINIIP